jgi:hypothetical protein
MAMKLSGATDSTIMRIRGWTPLTYLTYIHTQIGALLSGWHGRCPGASHFRTLGNFRWVFQLDIGVVLG